MECWTCHLPVNVANICDTMDLDDEDSPHYDPGFDDWVFDWIKELGLAAGRSKSGDIGIHCAACGALQGGFFILESYIDLIYEPNDIRTVAMPAALVNRE